MAQFGIKDESVICFAGEDWWYHHPHSKYHIAKRFARENKVMFVNSIGYGMPSLSNPDFFLKIKRKLKSYMRWLKKAPEGVWVLTPIAIPLYQYSLARKFNRFFLTLQVRLAMMIAGMRRPIVWVATPFAADVVQHLGSKLLVYHVSDKYEANEDAATPKSVIQAVDRWLKEKAALVMYSGRKLFQEATEPHRYFLEQAVDFDHFATEASTAAADVADLKSPVLGYFGWMDFVMDSDLVAEVSRRRPNWQWLFIGTRSNHFHVDAANVRFVGPKPYKELPNYLKKIDVCILPWRATNTFTSYGSAIKVKEYLATGKPVVIAPLFEYMNTPGIRIYEGVDQFIAMIEDALTNDTAENRKVRQDSVRNSTWDARALELGARLAALCRPEAVAAKQAKSQADSAHA
jgi:glycosyltransferase involved in cell wall biosynthesis